MIRGRRAHWLVTSTKGENGIKAEGVSQVETWVQAVEQAGVLGRCGNYWWA